MDDRQPLAVRAPAKYRRRLTERHFADVLREITDLVAGTDDMQGLRIAGPELLRRAKHEGRDGYPTSTRSVTGRGGDMHPDPVGDLIASEGMSDPIRRHALAMCEALLLARDVLRAAHGAWQHSVPPREKPVEPGVEWCLVHFRFGIHVPARTKGRCRWCEDWTAAWAREHGGERMDPPEIAIRALEDRRVEREQTRRAA